MVRIGLAAVVVGAVFFFALPKIADLSEVWESLREMTWIELASLTTIALWNIATYWFVMMSALPGSNVWQTMKVNQASTAVANTMPGGGAIGVGVTFGMYSGYGFSRSEIALSILVSGIWNNFVKLGMPIVALALLASTGDASGALMTAAVVGLIVLAIAILTFGAVLRSDRLATRTGRGLDRIVTPVRRVLRRPAETPFERSTLALRRDAAALVQRRWLPLTISSVVSHVALYTVLLLALRHVGVGSGRVSWIEALAAFAFVRLVSALPITPGGIGVVELGLTAALIAAGGPRAEVVAAVLVYRGLTYLLPIPFGLAAYVRWRRGSEARQARLAHDADAGLLAEAAPSTPPA